ncbi:MAG: hypothetical protein HC765_12935 [Brachymonas sp.]|nr:hypothetical protein [Brachymonas sp.]
MAQLLACWAILIESRPELNIPEMEVSGMMTASASTLLNYPGKEDVAPEWVWSHLTPAHQHEVFESLVKLCWQIVQSVEMTTADADPAVRHKDEVAHEDEVADESA